MRWFDRDMTLLDGYMTTERRIYVRYPQSSTVYPQHIHRPTMPDSRARASYLLRTNPQTRYVSRQPDQTQCGKPRSSLTGYGASMP
jgi:hypothetical protein